MKTLDSIHLASALRLGATVVSHDANMLRVLAIWGCRRWIRSADPGLTFRGTRVSPAVEDGRDPTVVVSRRSWRVADEGQPRPSGPRLRR